LIQALTIGDQVAVDRSHPSWLLGIRVSEVSEGCAVHVQDWSPEKKQTVAVGQGTLDWKKIFTAAKAAGVKNYFVEMNLDLMKASVPYLQKLDV